jgi:hypothetical protein
MPFPQQLYISKEQTRWLKITTAMSLLKTHQLLKDKEWTKSQIISIVVLTLIPLTIKEGSVC